MPFVLLFIGALLLASGVNGQTKTLFTLVKGDIEAGYIYWIISILVIGALGYIDELRPISRAFMALVIVVLVLKAGNPLSSNGGLFQSFQNQIKQGPQNSTGS
jgi:hypothetical protein